MRVALGGSLLRQIHEFLEVGLDHLKLGGECIERLGIFLDGSGVYRGGLYEFDGEVDEGDACGRDFHDVDYVVLRWRGEKATSFQSVPA